MQFYTSDNIAAASALIAFVALIFAFLAWRYPRTPRAKATPSFEGEISTATAERFARFLDQHDSKIVRLRVMAPFDDEVIGESFNEAGEAQHNLTVTSADPEQAGYGGVEISINASQKGGASPVVYANGGYHLNGYFLVKRHPGMWQGFTAMSLTEVEAHQVALRS